MDVAGSGNGSGGGASSSSGVSAATVAAALAQVHSMQAHALAAVVSTVNSTTSSSGNADIDSLLTSNTTSGNNAEATTLATSAAAAPLQQQPQQPQQPRRAFEPYEHRRAHDLRAECYRRGIRPIKKGPHANDNKGGYIMLLRQDDSAALSASSLVVHGSQESALLTSSSNSSTMNTTSSSSGNNNNVASDCGPDRMGRRHDRNGGDEQERVNAAKKRKLPSGLGLSQPQQHERERCDGAGSSGTSSPTSAVSSSESAATGAGLDGAAATPGVADLTSFYESGQAALQYASSLPKQPANSTTDLEILSGIANTYTQNASSSESSAPPHPQQQQQQLCTSCRTVATDQLNESMRLGKSKLERLASEQRERDTVHLQLVLRTLAELRQTYRQTASDTSARSRNVLAELDNDIAFFVLLKERAKERMRLAMQAESSSGSGRVPGSQTIGSNSSGGSGGSSSASSGAV